MEHDVQAVRMMYLRLSQEKGRWLMTEELDQIIDGLEGKISYNIIRQNYAGLQDLRNDLISSYWEEVQPLLGNRLPFYLSQHEIAAKYCQASREVKHWLTVEELRESNVGGLSYDALYETIGGVRTARKMAMEMFRGELEKENSPLLKRKKEPTIHVFSGDEIIESYFRESAARGCWLNSLQVRAHPELPSHQTVYARIGSFRALQALAEERFGVPYKGKTWDGQQNASEAEEQEVREYYLASKAEQGWLPREKVSDVLYFGFGGLARLRKHATVRYGNLV